MRYVAFLRGINLGPHRQLAMGDLRRCLTANGLRDVATHLRSGNVLLTSDEGRDPLRRRLEEVIRREFDMVVGVVVRDAEQMAQIVAACPYADAARDDPTKVHATFLDPMPPPIAWADLEPDGFRPDEFSVDQDVVYLHLPNGMGRAKLPAAVERAAGDAIATTRNWRTVTALADLAIAP